MKYFNVPADFKKESIDKYSEFNKKYIDSKVIETYGQITVDNEIGSGRAGSLIPQMNMDGLKEYIEYSKEKGIGFNYTLNTTCMGNMEFHKEGLKKIIQFLDELYYIGVRSLTLALPSLIELVKIKKLDFEIKASTLCSITNANKAMFFKNIGVDRLVADESINREFDALKRIRECFGEKVELICNVVCHKNCAYRMFHYNFTSHELNGKEQEGKDGYSSYYSHRCMMQRCSSVSNITKLSWIRPEDLKYYAEIGIEYFKIQGRQAVINGDPYRTLEAYAEESFDGNLMELLDMFSPTNSFQPYVDNKKLEGFIEPFVKQQEFCKNDCSKCNYCESAIKKCTDYEQTKNIFSTATEFYKEYDSFIKQSETLYDEKKEKGKSLAEQLFYKDIC